MTAAHRPPHPHRPRTLSIRQIAGNRTLANFRFWRTRAYTNVVYLAGQCERQLSLPPLPTLNGITIVVMDFLEADVHTDARP